MACRGVVSVRTCSRWFCHGLGQSEILNPHKTEAVLSSDFSDDCISPGRSLMIAEMIVVSVSREVGGRLQKLWGAVHGLCGISCSVRFLILFFTGRRCGGWP